MKSFLSGRTQIQSSSLENTSGISGAKNSFNAGKHGHDNAAAVTVETVKQGDKVVRIVVTCSCGEKIEIDCLYPTGS